MAANKSKNNVPLVIGAAVALCLAVGVMVFPKSSGQKTDGAQTIAEDSKQNTDEVQATVKDSGQKANGVQVIEEGESLVIPVDEITSVVRFYPVEVDGTSMEVLAVKDVNGTIRTAFNTCQICYSSGKGYYVQDGDALVCQNCGNRFTIDQVEVESGGCNPWPIFEESKTVTEDAIEISYDFLRESKEIFSNWKMVSMQ